MSVGPVAPTPRRQHRLRVKVRRLRRRFRHQRRDMRSWKAQHEREHRHISGGHSGLGGHQGREHSRGGAHAPSLLHDAPKPLPKSASTRLWNAGQSGVSLYQWGTTAAVVVAMLWGYQQYFAAPTAAEVLCGVTTPGGLSALAGDAGEVLNGLTGDAPSVSDVRGVLTGAAGTVGQAYEAFSAGVQGKSAAPADGVPPTDLVSVGDRNGGIEVAALVALEAGWTGEDAVTAVAIAGAESGYDPLAENDHSTAKGMWQIMMSYHQPLFHGADWRDPYANAQVAHRLWEESGWRPWVVYTSGAYKSHLAEARAAVANAQAPTVLASASFEGAGAPSCVDTGTTQDSAFITGGPSPASFDRLGNPRTVAQALAYDSRMDAADTPIPTNQCLHYVAAAYGWSSSNVGTAYGQWVATPARYKTVGGTPPKGALVFWSTSNPAGHVAISAGGGYVYSTDWPRAGVIGLAPIATIDGWGTRLGWSAPFFVGNA